MKISPKTNRNSNSGTTKKYLISKGVDGSRISLSLQKDSKPSNSSGTDVGNAKNRNIEFVISK